ncbi:MAG: tRNA (adenine-N1)-methyltransferase [Candidatus Fischerbacteria bacterium RBG_13_37_8]|uniref:tRNA (adenine(58)-N(1))-methyltransferase TrmI n=1 Tax=Candidatus Fischerbacteria bacterium RBG_13_37_8 TaxID=1817863 RepID=A0A1F5V627_9BACT|nr:MAG: tRNA (adenine-N1)-methyltransferase [Candidatus Fischerbacteria bacterium RBG_13_37_8]
MFSECDLVLIIDEKGRKYIFRLKKGGKFSSHLGTIEHNDLIGKEEGSMAKSQLGSEFLIFKPLYKDYIVKMPRGAQVIYPKDVATILLWADIFPGARVVEAGTGSGALTIALLRAIGTTGMLFSYEIREDFYKKAMKNIEEFMSLPNNLILKNKDIYEGIDEDIVDRVVLDLPEPWHVIPLLENSLKNGGIFLALLPTTIQVMNLVDSLEASRRFYPIEVFETMLRYWNVRGQSVRPEHFMVGHTAFIVIARKVAGNPSLFPRSMEHWKIGF